MNIQNGINFLCLLVLFSIYPSRGYGKKEGGIDQQLENNVVSYIDELQQNISHTAECTISLHEKLSQIKQSTTLKQMFTLLNQLDESLLKENKQIELAVSIQALALLHTYTSRMLLQLLVIIDSYLSYWQEMNDYPFYYFFHKSPSKWFIGKNQQREVDNNARLLSTLQKKYLDILGALTKQAQQFPAQATSEDYLRWGKKSILIMQELYTQECEGVRDEAQTIQIRNLIYCVPIYQEYASHCIATLKPPHHFARHWLKYVLLCAGISIAYKNGEYVDTWIGKKACHQYKESVYQAWHKYFVNPLQELYAIIMSSDEQKKLSLVRKEHVEKYMKDAEESKVIARELIEDYLQKEHKNGRLTNEQLKEAWEEIQKDNIGPLQRLKNCVLKPNWRNTYDFTGEIDYHSNFAQFIFWSNREKAVKGLVHVVDFLDSEFKRNQTTLRFTALIPAIVTGLGLYKVTNKFYQYIITKNYSTLRAILAKINTMFIALHGNMDNESYGSLMYLLYKLKNAVLKQVTNKNVKMEMLQDIETLSLYNVTTEEKRLLVDNMRWKYSFLSPHYFT